MQANHGAACHPCAVEHMNEDRESAMSKSFDAQAIQQTIQRALASAGLDTRAGPMREVMDTIQRSLGAGPPVAAAPPAADVQVIDVVARVVDVARAGSFENFEFSNHAGTRAYKLYVPAGGPAAPRPVVVMLHGCTQNADDFAAGTQMNRLADEHGFLVIYPEQPQQANPSKCWNWFKRQDQMCDAGEPALIAGITREVAQRHGADTGRIFIAGLSAGAAMAVVLGETYPELFAGVGVHSGLPYGSAHDIPSAMAAMKGGRSGLPGAKNLPGAAAKVRRKAAQAVPTIVFHGDRDHTVQHSNAEAIVHQAREAYRAREAGAELSASTQAGGSAGGHGYSRTVYADAQGRTHIELWTVHGAGHAWQGGHASGSYTDARGPDASAEMLRFFMASAA
jgi:poly(hydroxyalkanoate) depolymerase family esterase